MWIIIFIIFLALKLEKIIDWPWKWVTSPLWLPICFILVIYLIALLIGGILAIFGILIF